MKMKLTALITAIVLSGGVLLVVTVVPSCHKSSGGGGGKTLYDSLGGTVVVTDPVNFGQTVEQGYLTIRSIVDTTLILIQGDSLINNYFSIVVTEDTLHQAPTEFDKLRLNISNFLASAAGSEHYTYNGPSLFSAHNPDSNANMRMAVDSASFNQFAYDLGRGSADYKLSAQLISQLGHLLYRYESQVVQP